MAEYAVEQVVVGELVQREVDAVRMSRTRFLEIVDGVLVDYPHLRDELRPVAECMPRFPMGQWVDPERGCGCVVGEYLIATSRSRAELACESVEAVLDESGRGDLVRVGIAIDNALDREVNGKREYDWNKSGPWPETIVIDDVEVSDG